jgi:integrase
LAVVSKLLRHSSPQVTAQIYVHAVGREEVDAVERWEVKMGNALRGSKAATKPVN